MGKCSRDIGVLLDRTIRMFVENGHWLFLENAMGNGSRDIRVFVENGHYPFFFFINFNLM